MLLLSLCNCRKTLGSNFRGQQLLDPLGNKRTLKSILAGNGKNLFPFILQKWRITIYNQTCFVYTVDDISIGFYFGHKQLYLCSDPFSSIMDHWSSHFVRIVSVTGTKKTSLVIVQLEAEKYWKILLAWHRFWAWRTWTFGHKRSAWHIRWWAH